MLKGKNVVIVKGEKGAEPQIREYERVYLEFAATDPVEDYEKTTEGKTLQINGINWKGVRPKDAQTSANPEDLVPEALAYFQAKYPGSKEKPSNAWLTLLEAASYGADLWERNTIQASIRPTKPIDRTAAIEKMVKLLISLNPKMSREKAVLVATAATEEEPETATV